MSTKQIHTRISEDAGIFLEDYGKLGQVAQDVLECWPSIVIGTRRELTDQFNDDELRTIYTTMKGIEVPPRSLGLTLVPQLRERGFGKLADQVDKFTRMQRVVLELEATTEESEAEFLRHLGGK